MDKEGFTKFCVERKLGEKTIQANIGVIQEFENYLKTKNLNDATSADLKRFVRKLLREKKNTEENLLALARYARFTNNHEVIVASLELLDGSDVLKILSGTIKETIGETKHNEIFEGIELPPLGTEQKDRPKITKKFMERIEDRLGEDKTKEILSTGPHAGPKKYYLHERKRFLESKGIDDFLKKRHEEYVAELEKHMKEGTLYYTQEIDEKVLDYVRKTPTCQNGVREGDIIYVTKIPYMAKYYLREKSPKKKRYYACHCPWVREAISTDMKISPNFCYCSAGFEKRPWDVIFDCDVKADVVESVLNGDLMCKFAIHIPKEHTKSNTKHRMRRN